MSEPTYQYVKGQGWVIGGGARVYEWGYFRVTIEDRPPEMNERYVTSKNIDTELFVDAFKCAWNWKYVRRGTLPDLEEIVTNSYEHYVATSKYPNNKARYYYTVKVERIFTP